VVPGVGCLPPGPAPAPRAATAPLLAAPAAPGQQPPPWLPAPQGAQRQPHEGQEQEQVGRQEPRQEPRPQPRQEPRPQPRQERLPRPLALSRAGRWRATGSRAWWLRWLAALSWGGPRAAVAAGCGAACGQCHTVCGEPDRPRTPVHSILASVCARVCTLHGYVATDDNQPHRHVLACC
jgi:hypothetical protein